jgi:hypothetical protein
MSILKSCNWSKPALHLLESTKQLDPNKPAILHIRHTERTIANIDHNYNLNQMLSTDTGKRTANEFGSLLPLDRKIKLFYTYVDRSRETTEAIHKGIKDAGGISELVGVIPNRAVVDIVEQAKLIRTIQSRNEYSEDGAYYVTCLWIAGLIPTTVFKPSLEFAKQYAEITVGNLKNASTDELHVYVTHDSTVLNLIFHWFGLPPYGDGCRFLEGFLMQLGDDGMNVWLRDKDEVYPYPYWWPK